jgi:hypothetical protein
VVADEVRNLAMRSAAAAKNTAQLLEESSQNANAGVAINHEVLINLEEINGQVNKVSMVMQEITLASEKQPPASLWPSIGLGEYSRLRCRSTPEAFLNFSYLRAGLRRPADG